MECGAEYRAGENPFMERRRFEALGREFSRVPLYDSLPLGDAEPLELFARLGGGGPSTMLWEGCSSSGELEYALLVTEPSRIFRVLSGGVEEERGIGGEREFHPGTSLEELLEPELAAFPLPDREHLPELPFFRGGYLGYFGHAMAGTWDTLFSRQPGRTLRAGDVPLAVVLEAERFVCLDVLKGRIYCVASLAGASFSQAAETVEDLKRRVEDALEGERRENKPLAFNLGAPRSNISRKAFYRMVEQGREAIRNGEVSQVVLSQKFCLEGAADPLRVYEALRKTNPSPYHVYMGCENFTLLASSPEVHLSRRGNRVHTRPLAGTRPRGITPEEDQKLEQELRKDPKECAEHLMLVDLARNDLGRFCRSGSVTVPLFQEVDRYARVMHLVSQVEGEAEPGASSLEMLGKTFPAGTLSGAPKIRALEIIDTLEAEPRGAYGGVLGWLEFSGDMETCITIRTVEHHKDRLYLQAGAGIVFDSSPEGEYRETLCKAEALVRALGCSFEELKEEESA